MKRAVAVVLAALIVATTANAGRPGHRSATAQRLNHGLQGSPMAGTGFALERAAFRWHVSPYFIAAIAATESSLGRAGCSGNRRNAFGLSSCGSGWYVPYFRTWGHAYQFMGRFLSSRWRGHSTPWSFRGYAACSDCWARRTAYWMRRLFGVGYGTRYP